MSEMSLKFGFFGLGMGGCSIASECAGIRTDIRNNRHPYSALLVNTNELDLRKLPDRANARKYILRGYERGAGRDIQLGEEAFVKHKDEITRQICNLFADRDFVFVVCGLGGGTGTGCVIEAIRLLHANGFRGRFGLILTLPRDQEGRKVLDNALLRLQTITKAMKGLGCILPVDNQKLFEDYLRINGRGNVSDFLHQSNQYIAQTLHELNVVTARYNPTGAYHFDASELFKILQTSGIVSMGKCSIDERSVDAENQGTYMPILKQAIEDGVLSSGYHFPDAIRCATSIVTNPSAARRIFTVSMINSIERQMLEYSPFADERPVATYTDETLRQVCFYTVFAGLSFPRRIAELVGVAMQFDRDTKREDDAIAALQGYKSLQGREQTDLESLLGEPATSDSKDRTSDPFAF